MIFVKSKYMRVIEPDYRLGLMFKAQLQLATEMRVRIRALELWLPLTFATAGLIWIAVGFCTLRRGAR